MLCVGWGGELILGPLLKRVRVDLTVAKSPPSAVLSASEAVDDEVAADGCAATFRPKERIMPIWLDSRAMGLNELVM